MSSSGERAQLSLADITERLADPRLSSEERGVLLLRQGSLRQAELSATEFLAITEDALVLLSDADPDGDFHSDHVTAQALNAALNVMVGNLVQGLEQGVRLQNEPDLSMSARNSLAIMFQYAGAYELATEIWGDMVDAAAAESNEELLIGASVNLIEALSRQDLRRPDTDDAPNRGPRIAGVKRAIRPIAERHRHEAAGPSLQSQARLALAATEMLDGDIDAAARWWGDTDALALETAPTIAQLYAAFETRLALHRGDHGRAEELIEFGLQDRPPESALQLGQVEANLHLAALRAAQGDTTGSVAAAQAAANAALATRRLQPEILINETRQRVLTEQARAELEERALFLAREARIDALTGLATRRVLDEVIEEYADSLENLCVLFIDIDRFKRLNDRYGHHLGDQVLAAVGRVLGQQAGPADVVVRYGGEEFVVLARTELERGPAALAEAIRIAIADFNWDVFGLDAGVTCSVGAAAGPGGDLATLLQAADLAVCEAKRTGRDRIVVRDHVSPEVMYRSRTEELSRAIEEEQFVVEYQPIWDIQRGVAVGIEALVRWDHPERGRVTPGEFIPVAEGLGLVDEIDRLVWRRACLDLAALQQGDDPALQDLWVSLNMSAHDLGSPCLVGALSECIEEAGLAPEVVVVEVTESRMAHPDLATAELQALRALGVRVALDDFGSGYSSLAQLHRLPIDILKVDASFVREPTALDRVLSHILDLGASMGMSAAVEGVETPAQLSAVREMGAVLAQGYLLARPADLGSCVEMIRDAATNGLAVVANAS